jgi:HEAT repeat protein
MKRLLLVVLVSGSWVGCAHKAEETFGDWLGMARLKTYSAHRASSENRYVFSNEDAKHLVPGETLVIADLQGPGVVTHIWFTAAANEFAWPRLFRVRAYYDGKKTPSVDAPLGDFFGVGNGYEADLDSAMVRDTSLGRARNSYWPMPFRKSCRITVTNEGKRMKSLYFHVDWRKYASLPDDVAYFHAYYRQERPAVSGRNYAFLSIRGRGHYVGTVLSVLQTQISWFGEGDDLFYVDGTTHPQIFGTGSEDYFNEAWGLRQSSGPWTGSPVAEGERVGSRLTGYRWHVPDPIPFTTSLWAGIEHRGWTYNPDGTARTAFEERPDYFSSVAFWYQVGVNEDLPEPPYGDERLPVGNARQITIQDAIKDVTAEKGNAIVQKNVDWGKDLLFLHARGVGARMNIPFDVAEAGRYELVAEIAQAPNYGNYVALVDGQPTNLDLRKPESSEIPFPGPVVYHSYQPEVYVGAAQPLGFFRFEKGRHTVSLVCVGKDEASAGYDVGIYDVVLEELPATVGEPGPAGDVVATPTLPVPAPPVPAGTVVYRGRPLQDYLEKLKSAPEASRPDVIRALGAFGEDAATAVPKVTESLGDSNADVRVAAAWALSQIGRAGASAAAALGHALSDASPQVRVLAALSLKAMGSSAAAAVPQLTNALKDPVDDVRVSAARALGAMGSSARAAVQPLSDLLFEAGHRDVRVSAATALGDIGPDAKSALPALEQTVKARSAGPAAQEAILRIQGKPVPTWWEEQRR